MNQGKNKKNWEDNSHLELDRTEIVAKIQILKIFRKSTDKITKIGQIKTLLDLLCYNLKDFDNSAVEKFYECSDNEMKKTILQAYLCMVDTVIEDKGNLLLSISILKQGKPGYRAYTKLQAFQSVCYVFLYFTHHYFTYYRFDEFKRRPSNLGKFLCIMNYVSQIKRIQDEGKISYLNSNYLLIIRQVSNEFTNLSQEKSFIEELSSPNITAKADKIKCSLDDSLYDLGAGNIEADFANKYIGGGTLSGGNVQEEIKFVINPELILSMCMCEFMLDNESIYVIGSEQFSNYKGYGCSFTFSENRFNFQEIENIKTFIYSGNTYSCIDSILVAFDAKKYFKFQENFEIPNFVREIKKAYSAFRPLADSGDELINLKNIATGKWGCGVFNGDSELKFLVQFIICVYFDRGMLFTCYKDKPVYDKINNFLAFLSESNVTLKMIVESLLKILNKKDLPEGTSILNSLIEKLYNN